MANLFVQTVRIFTHYSIQTIQTLNFIFVSALHMIMSTQYDKNIMIMSHRIHTEPSQIEGILSQSTF